MVLKVNVSSCNVQTVTGWDPKKISIAHSSVPTYCLFFTSPKISNQKSPSDFSQCLLGVLDYCKELKN